MSDPREVGIQFSTPMVRAILGGKKTQTRRIAKPDGSFKYGPVGTRLWVKESFRVVERPELPGSRIIQYKSHGGDELGSWTNPRFMRKEYAEIWLEVTDVRHERLHDITEKDAELEGFYQEYCGGGWRGDSAKAQFRNIWESLYGNDAVKGWSANPLVEVVTFKVVTP